LLAYAASLVETFAIIIVMDLTFAFFAFTSVAAAAAVEDKTIVAAQLLAL
jgi:hypothetical protein